MKVFYIAKDITEILQDNQNKCIKNKINISYYGEKIESFSDN